MGFLEALRAVAQNAVTAGVCSMCEEEVRFEEADQADGEGHVYSVDGVREYGITGCCEFCFDQLAGSA